MLDEMINRLIRYPGALRMRLRMLKLRSLGVRIGHKCWIRRVRIDRNPWDISLAEGVALDDDVVLLTTGSRCSRPRIEIGQKVYINRFTMIDASESIRIGSHTMIGPYCYITDHDHSVGEGCRLGEMPLVGSPVTIGRNVWLGAKVVVLKGVTIGDNAIIGAGAVVTRNVAAGTTAVGVPARTLPRFGETTVELEKDLLH
jgi:acetyltransferase-like isoleucine patch superfamily enzyme